MKNEIDCIRGFSKYIKTNEKFEPYIMIDDLSKFLNDQPIAYDLDKTVEELNEAMQDLSVIEIFSHIDFDSTIQSGLDNFLKAYNSELLRIVKQGGVSDDVCKWTKIDEEGYKNCKCNYDETIPDFFKYCPYCGKKIKVVEV